MNKILLKKNLRPPGLFLCPKTKTSLKLLWNPSKTHQWLPWGARAYVCTRKHFFQKSFFYLEYSTYICIVNQLKNHKMEKVFDVVAKVWVGSLMIITIVSLTYTIIQLCTGNYQGTASFEP